LYSMTSRGPHQTNMANRELSSVETTVRRLCGHPATGPSGELAQSNERIMAPISPPSERQSIGWAGDAAGEGALDAPEYSSLKRSLRACPDGRKQALNVVKGVHAKRLPADHEVANVRTN
jgi:hypothetical protein